MEALTENVMTQSMVRQQHLQVFKRLRLFCAASLFRKYTTCLIQIYLSYTCLGGLKGAKCNFYLTEMSLSRPATSALGVSVDLGREALRRMNSSAQ